MRHLYILLFFFIISSLVFSFALFRDNKSEGVPAIIINDKIITKTELKKLIGLKPQNVDRLEFIDSIITREILIQKALKEKIHKEESFRKSIQDHYENLLINILKDRKYRSLKVNVSNREIYRSAPDKKLSDDEMEIIRQKLADGKKQEQFDNWIKDLKQQGKVETIEQ